ncbi:MAG: hypothetical protein JNJ59_16830 [Deltaproteobacteria bacterium]|nr:hypothetical protein [Deltaproteobacteria bacterium]
MTKSNVVRVSALAVVGISGLLGCGQSAPSGPGVEIAVKPLTLAGIDYACYDLEVRNDLGQVVWSKGTSAAEGGAPAVCSNDFGNLGGGDISYVGPCDASDNTTTDTGTAKNTIILRVDGLYDSEGADIGQYENPCPWPDGCKLDFECVENADVPVVFNLTVLREANQGFFDIAVNFEDIFCSAKLDCQYATGNAEAPWRPIELLHKPDGQRGQTAVLAFACTSGAGEATLLHMNPIAVTCGSAAPILIDPAAGPGNLFTATDPDPNPSDAVWQVAVYRGAESLDCGNAPCNKVYWNVAVGFDPSVADCRITSSATASSTSQMGDDLTPSATTWPWNAFDVTLTGASGGLVCDANPVNVVGSGVRTRYTDTDARKYFCNDFDGTTVNASTAPECTTPTGFFADPEPKLHGLLEAVEPGYCRPTQDDLATIGTIGRWATNAATFYLAPELGAKALGLTPATATTRGAFGYYLREQYLGLATQPEAFASRGVNLAPFLYPSGVAITSPCEQMGRMVGLGALFRGEAQQPELREELLGYAAYSGPLSLTSDPKVIVARSAAVGEVLAGIGRQPEAGDNLLADALTLLGAFTEPVGPGAATAAIVARLIPTREALYATAAQPEAGSAILAAGLTLIGNPVALEGPIGETVRSELLDAYADAVDLQPEAQPLLAQVLLALAGINVAGPSNNVSFAITATVTSPGSLAVGVGETITVTLSYDAGQSPSSFDDFRADYASYSLSLTVGAETFTADPGSSLMTINNESFGDALLTNGTNSGYIGMSLIWGAGAGLASTALPTDLSASGLTENFIVIPGTGLFASVTSITNL